MIDENNDTIVSISTPSGLGAVGIVRLSGARSGEIAQKLFSAISKREVKNFEHGKLYLGVLDTGVVKDKCLAVYFKSPRSFTGEDIVEFQCHGGRVVLESLVKKTVELGARLATNGEFSRRAFLNGKMDLSNVEGMADLINAESVASSKLSYQVFSGGVSFEVKKLQSELELSIAYVEAAFDYPEEDVPPMNVPEVTEILKRQIEKLGNMTKTYRLGQMAMSGVKVAILGKPNVGKSSLLNAILGMKRAIVTDIAGTTRDVLTVKYNYKGVDFELFDTAGIHEANDEIEKIGIQMARDTLQSADLVLATFDCTRALEKEDAQIIKEIADKNAIILINKTDATKNLQAFENELTKNFSTLPEVLDISAKTGLNVDTLKEKLFQKSHADKLLSTESLVLTNERHFFALGEARARLEAALEGIDFLPPDCLILDLREAWNKYGEITGTTASEHIIDTIFAKLCLGK